MAGNDCFGTGVNDDVIGHCEEEFDRINVDDDFVGVGTASPLIFQFPKLKHPVQGTTLMIGHQNL